MIILVFPSSLVQVGHQGKGGDKSISGFVVGTSLSISVGGVELGSGQAHLC